MGQCLKVVKVVVYFGALVTCGDVVFRVGIRHTYWNCEYCVLKNSDERNANKISNIYYQHIITKKYYFASAVRLYLKNTTTPLV